MPAKTELPELPERNADPQTHLDFANKALRRFENRIARIRKLGNVAPLLVLVMENSDQLALQPKHHRYGHGLKQALLSYDGQSCPHYSQAQLEQIFGALIRASDLWEADNTRDEILSDLNALLNHSLTDSDHAPLRYSASSEDAVFYRAISDFQTINRRRTGHPQDMPPIPLFWRTLADHHDKITDELWYPRGALNTYFRAVRSPFAGAELRGMLWTFGWQQRELEARNKGDWRRRVHVRAWVIPVPWTDAELDLSAILEATPETS